MHQQPEQLPFLNNSLSLFEDGIAVEQIGDVKVVLQPVTVIYFYDMGPDGSSILETEFNRIMLSIHERPRFQLKEIVCSTKAEIACVTVSSLQTNQLTDIYQKLVDTKTNNIPLEDIFPQVISLWHKVQGEKILVIVKNWRSNSISYLPETLLSSNYPTILINLTDSSDPVGLPQALRALVEASNNYYLGSGAWKDEANGYQNAIQETIRQDYQVSYKSHVFHDGNTHQITVRFQGEGVDTWDTDYFSFQSFDGSIKGSLIPGMNYVIEFFMILIPFFLIYILVIIEPD